MALPLLETRHTTTRTPRFSRRLSSERTDDTRYFDACYYHPKWGLIYPEAVGTQVYAVGGNTRVQCTSWGQALRICREWDQTGRCPAPKNRRLTPRTMI